jgi:hypothetical protein
MVSAYYHPNIEPCAPLWNRMYAQWKILCSSHQEGAQTGLGIVLMRQNTICGRLPNFLGK